MHKARAFFYVCAGLFLLALSYHLGARNAGAQAPGNPVVGITGTNGDLTAVTSNGDTYFTNSSLIGGNAQWFLKGNVFGPYTPTQRESFGAVKSRYRGSAQPQNR